MNEEGENEPAITLLLNKWRLGDADAVDEVMRFVYDDLCRRANAYLRNDRREYTLQPTGLVHEAFIKLLDRNEIEWQDRNHFFATAAQAMRWILVDHARGRRRGKRGGPNEDVPLDDLGVEPSSQPRPDLIALDEALGRLATFDDRQARIVELKYFGGMTIEETADILGISPETVKRDWRIARAWLRHQME